MLHVTDAALEQIRSAALQGRVVGMPLRVAARRADDGSIEYGMGFDDTHDQDAALALGDLTIVIADSSRDLLAGTTLDYVELQPGEFRFIFVPGQADDAAPQGGGQGCGSGGCARCS